MLLVERPDLVAEPVALEWTRLGAQPTHWDLFDDAGVFVGTLVLPAGFTPHVLYRDAVLGVGRDELGVEYVVRLAFDASPVAR